MKYYLNYYIILIYRPYNINLFLNCKLMSYIVNICFIGDSSQGKSSIASRFTDDRCQKNYESRINVNFANQMKE